MEWYNGAWCVTIDELTRDDRTQDNQNETLAPILVRSNYDTMAKRGKIKVVRQGKGKGNYALIAFDSLPAGMQERLRMKYPDMSREMQRLTNPAFALFRKAYERDYKALAHYIGVLQGLAQSLTEERLMQLANEYATNASVIQAVLKLRRENELYRKVRGRRGVSWADMSEVIKFYQSEYGHTLGVSPTRFAQWVRKYEAEGYDALISRKFGNANTLKMAVHVEKLLFAMAEDPHKPYKHSVWEWYCAFRRGEELYYSKETGELYNPEDYPDISERSVSAFLQREDIVARLSKVHDNRHDYMTSVRPHNKRRKPKYSLSMITMDDKDFSVKVSVGKKSKPTALKGYFAFDVASGAIVGWAFSTTKDTNLYLECVRSMYRNLLSWGLGQPHEAQVENHLVSQFKETLMAKGHLFPEVTFAGAENSQEKYAERFFRDFKYQMEKQHIVGVGRHYAKERANRVRQQKVSDDTNVNYAQAVYAYDKTVALYTLMIHEWNAMPHPEPKKYSGKTRMEVLLGCVAPGIEAINRRSLARWAGWSVETSIVRGQVRARYEDYAIPFEMLSKLRHGSNKVTAYWWEQDPLETVDSIYLYQEGVYLDEVERILPYQVSKLERTEADLKLLGKQRQRVAQWDEAIRAHAGEAVGRLKAEESQAMEIEPIAVVPMPLEEDFDLEDKDYETSTTDYASRAWADL